MSLHWTGEAQLTQEYLREILDYNPDTGIFTWKVRKSMNVYPGDVTGASDQDGYLLTKIDGKTYKLHRVAWLYMTGSWPKGEIDHDNHLPDDNRWNNLFDVTMPENMLNRTLDKRSRSGVSGVIPYKNTGRWKVYINKDKKEHFLGYFTDFFEAVCSRKSAERRLGFHENHGRPRCA